MREFIGLGFKAIIVSCKADIMGKEFLGRYITSELIDELTGMNICPCGENGEYHTLVVDGPIFKRPINILKSSPILKDGFWKHWFLDIEEYN
jgi:diphthamide synthase (EF-2-diphthine--ammonia ligase)